MGAGIPGAGRAAAGARVTAAPGDRGGAVRVEPLAARHLAAYQALFEAAHAPCFCRYWHFAGTKNQWLARCAEAPGENLQEATEALSAADPTSHGLLALAGDGRAVGWLKVAPILALPKLRGLPVYRAVPAPPGVAFGIGCVLVHPDARRRGVARALLAAAPAYARGLGATHLEAYPRRSSVPLHDEEVGQGPEALFRAAGFALVHDEAPYPVYRLTLA